jgi:hypothetical protein
VATSKAAVWVACSDGVVKEIDPATGSVRHVYPLGHTDPVALAVTGERVWVALA